MKKNSTNIKEEHTANKEYPNIIQFKKDITDTEEPYRQSNINLFKKDNEKFELLQPLLSDVINSLFAEKIILVEGIRDEAFVNILIDLINQKYEKYQYVLIMPIGGCDHAIKLGNILKEDYQINFFMILDLDDKNKQNNEEKLEKNKFNKEKYFLFKNDFESWIKEYCNIELPKQKNEKSNIEPLYKLYELDYDKFIIKNNECKELIEKIQNFLEE